MVKRISLALIWIGLICAAACATTTPPKSGDVRLIPQPTSPTSQRTETFIVTSQDEVDLAGQIDFPAHSNGPTPAVILIPGTGPFDRDVHFAIEDMEQYGPLDPRGLVFAELSKRIVESGVATVRFDKRGIRCNAVALRREQPSISSADISKRCIDPQVRWTVTPKTIRADIRTIYRHAANHPHIDPKSIVIFAHSEGTIHVAHLVAEQALEPSGLVFVGAVGESPKSVIHWQIVDRNIRDLSKLDGDGDGMLTVREIENDKVAKRLIQSPIFKQKIEHGLAIEALGPALETEYSQTAKQAIEADDTAPFAKLSSMAWWKMWFTDEHPVAELLSEYKGKVILHSGTNDAQTPSQREFERYREAAKNWITPPTLVEHEGLGHTLGSDPVYGPMDDTAATRLVSDIILLATPNARSGGTTP